MALLFKPQLVIFDFDGTLFDTHTSIAHCISRVFAVLAPESQPSLEDIQAIISTGAGLEDTFRILNPSPPQDLSQWITQYRAIYDKEGLPLITSFPGAEDILRILHQQGITAVISSNKGLKAIQTVVDQSGLDKFVNFIAADVPGIKRKPHVQSYEELIAPRFEGLDPTRVLVVGDTEADIQYARNIGAVAVWAKYGYGKQELVESMGPDFIIDGLKDIAKILPA
ncbi:hypothetical protein EG329_011390 [Mollisiaceae sp. DMI_Dod_QoI]|nr:hypothetical protein EG329_011390 [Helotiales sp. DMI_Dod_QoI]